MLCRALATVGARWRGTLTCTGRVRRADWRGVGLHGACAGVPLTSPRGLATLTPRHERVWMA